MAHSERPLVVIVGPTAVGKTALSIALAERLGGEIISADSRQVYAGMDIGTAKARTDERARVRHHLIDILRPDETLTVADFQKRTYAVIDEIHHRGVLPILVGGTGQHVAAVLDGWSIPSAAPTPAIRAELEAFAAIYGAGLLHSRLRMADPTAAASIDYRNVRRVVRALEVYLAEGTPISELQQRRPPPFRVLKLGLTMPRETLYERIDQRIDAMLDAGLIAEIEGLLNAGYTWELPAMSALGYQEFRNFLSGNGTLEEAIALVKRNTRAFVRKQYNWFRLSDETIHWLDALNLDLPAIAQGVLAWQAGGDYG